VKSEYVTFVDSNILSAGTPGFEQISRIENNLKM